MTFTEFLVAAVVLLLVFIVSSRITNWLKNLPPGPVGLPVVGYLPFMRNPPYLKFTELANKYGSIFSMYFSKQLIVVLNDGDEIRDAFSRKELLARSPKSPFSIIGIETPFFSPNIQLWQEQRRFVVHTMKDLGLGKTKIEGHVQDEIQQLLKILEQSERRPVDLTKPLTPSMSNNICSLVFGERYEYENPERIILDDALENFTRNLSFGNAILVFPWLRHIPILSKLFKKDKMLKALGTAVNIIQKKVTEHKETLDPKNIRDFTDCYLLESQNRKETDPKTTFTEPNLVGITLNLFGAGSETVRTSVSWCMYIMAAYPEIQNTVHKEIDDVIGSAKLPQFTDQKDMPYCQAVIREVLRWKTIAPVTPPRFTLEDIEISGFHIPKGSIVLGNLWAVHHDPKRWTNPEEFQPNRFLSQDGTIVKNNYFMPFSVGKRSCPGETMALMEIFLYFVSILQKFRISFPKGFNPTFETVAGITLKPKEFELCFSPK